MEIENFHTYFDDLNKFIAEIGDPRPLFSEDFKNIYPFKSFQEKLNHHGSRAIELGNLFTDKQFQRNLLKSRKEDFEKKITEDYYQLIPLIEMDADGRLPSSLREKKLRLQVCTDIFEDISLTMQAVINKIEKELDLIIEERNKHLNKIRFLESYMAREK